MNSYITVDWVKQRVAHIQSIAGDDEYAHIEEDELFYKVLTAIANNECQDNRTCAQEAIKSLDIDFRRWHA